MFEHWRVASWLVSFERSWLMIGGIQLSRLRKSSGYARSSLGPVPREKLMDSPCRVIGQAGKHVGEPSLRVDVEAIGEFAMAYADQTERDWKAFLAAIKAGRIVAGEP
jgi:hypothetical protein